MGWLFLFIYYLVRFSPSALNLCSFPSLVVHSFCLCNCFNVYFTLVKFVFVSIFFYTYIFFVIWKMVLFHCQTNFWSWNLFFAPVFLLCVRMCMCGWVCAFFLPLWNEIKMKPRDYAIYTLGFITIYPLLVCVCLFFVRCVCDVMRTKAHFATRSTSTNVWYV